MGQPIDLGDVTLKITRAEEHFAELDRKVRKWLDKNRIQIVHHHDPKTGRHELVGKHFPEPPREWATVVGDLGYNLRAALEYMVELLLLANHSTPQRSNQFPIISERKDAHLIRNIHLAGVHGDAIKAIEGVQPYARRKGTERDLLEIVGDLANIDKHHRLHATAILTERAQPNWFKMSIPETGVFIRSVLLPTRNPQPVSEADLIGFVIDPPDAKIEVDVDDSRPLPILIEFRNGAPFRLDVLPDCIAEVRAIFELLRPSIVDPPPPA
jgi:hypothetical protein